VCSEAELTELRKDSLTSHVAETDLPFSTALKALAALKAAAQELTPARRLTSLEIALRVQTEQFSFGVSGNPSGCRGIMDGSC
jgi:hypothetical protein